MSIKFWQRWLIVVTGGVIVYGLMLILLPQTTHTLFNTLFFASSESIRRIGTDSSHYVALVYGVLGAVIIGWMVTIMALLISSFPTQPRNTWNIITLSVVTWYIIDSGFSLVIGSLAHVLFNTGFFVLFAVPLIALYGHLRRKPVDDHF